MSIFDRVKNVLRNPETLGAIAVVVFGFLQEFLPALSGVVNLEVLIGLLGVLLGVGAGRSVGAREVREGQ